MYNSRANAVSGGSRKYDDTSAYIEEDKVKGHLASLLNDALVRIKMLEQELRLEKMKNGSIVSSSHSTPGREVYISPRHYEDLLASSGANSASTPRTKKKLLGPFSPQGGGFIQSLNNMAWAEELQNGGKQISELGDASSPRSNDHTSTMFSLAEAKNLQQTAARSKRTCDQLRETLATVQHEKTKFEMQHNHIKSKLTAVNERNLELERQILDLKDRMNSELDSSKQQIKTLSEDSSALLIEKERNKELEEQIRNLKGTNSAQTFAMNARKAHIRKLKQTIQEETDQKQALTTRINELMHDKRRLEGANSTQTEKLTRHQQELLASKNNLIVKNTEFNTLRDVKTRLENEVHQLKIDVETRQSQLQEAESKISSLNDKIMEMQVTMNSNQQILNNDKSELSEAKEALENELRELKRQYKDTKDHSRASKEELGKLTRKFEDAQKHLSVAKTDISSLQEELRQLKDEKHRVELRAQTSEDECHLLKEQLENLKLDIQREQEALEALRQEHSVAVGTASDAKSQSTIDREKISRLEKQLKFKSSALEKERGDAADLRKVKMELEIQLDRERREKEAEKERVKILDDRILQMDKEYEESMNKLHTMNKKTENVQVEMHSLHAQRQQVMRECDGLKDEIGRLKGLLEVAEANLERADEEKRAELSKAEERYKALERALENLRQNINKNSGNSRARRQSQIQLAAANAAATAINTANDGFDAGERDEDLRLRAMFSKGKQQTKSPMMIKFEKESILRSLNKSTTFKDIPRTALEAMIHRSNVYTFNIGDYIIKQGEMGSRMYVIATGKVRITRTQQEDAS